MSQQQLFLSLLMTVLMVASGVREIIKYDAPMLGIALIAVPGCFWLSNLFVRLPL